MGNLMICQEIKKCNEMFSPFSTVWDEKGGTSIKKRKGHNADASTRCVPDTADHVLDSVAKCLLLFKIL